MTSTNQPDPKQRVIIVICQHCGRRPLEIPQMNTKACVFVAATFKSFLCVMCSEVHLQLTPLLTASMN